MRRRFVSLLAFLGLLVLPLARATAQDPALVEALAPLLRAEDRKEFLPDLFENAAAHPEALVRRTAAVTIGRIGDRAGSALLIKLFDDRDSNVVADAIFAAGLLHDSTIVDAIIRRLKSTDSLSSGATAEAATALVRIGSPKAVAFVESVLKSEGEISRARRVAFIPNAVLDAWHLGARMPADAVLPFTMDTSVDLRWRALYSLGRARAPVGGKVLLRAATDQSPILREAAVKALTKRMVDTSAIPEANVHGVLIRGMDDERPGVRINALTSAQTFNDSTYAVRAAALLGDIDQNVRVQAAMSLVSMKGAVAAKALATAFDKKDATPALKAAALTALARVDTAAFRLRAAVWLKSADPHERMLALQGLGSLRSGDVAPFRAALADPDPMVQGAALSAWNMVARDDAELAAAIRSRLTNSKAELRATAAGLIRRSATVDDVDVLLSGWRMSLTDGDSDARLAIFGALSDLAKKTPDMMTRLDAASRRSFLSRPADPLVRRAAVQGWPAISAVWGPPGAVEVTKSMEDYRGIVRTLMLAKTNPHVTIETDTRGTLDIELLGKEAPLTVANFLRLVDRHYFDNIRWHRVVPNFVVQTGDPTGTGSGGPGWAIRDEITRRRYDVPMVGMALSGPDTGGSQWFINVSAQPHLDGGYTIFGSVSGSYAPLFRIVQGDLIRTIHR